MSSIPFTSYPAYLASPEWAARRQRIMVRDSETCVCGARAAQVHHLTYARIYNELDTDLRAVCLICHAKIHALQKQGYSLRAASDTIFKNPHHEFDFTVKPAPAPRPKRQRPDPNSKRSQRKARKAKNRALRMPPKGQLAREIAAMKARNAEREKTRRTELPGQHLPAHGELLATPTTQDTESSPSSTRSRRSQTL